jgi:predicted 2-oxoglutarate/Fe(II)-dependent dioxygenase YbiX
MIKIEEQLVEPRECNVIIEAIKAIGTPTNLAEGDPHTRYYDKRILIENDVFAYGVFEQICDKVLRAAEDFAGLELRIDLATLISVTPGNTPEEHADNQNLDGTEKIGCTNFFVSAVAYLNSNFTGGDLVFPKIDYRYKPNAGDCILFPSDLEHSHYVDNVYEGKRISLALWFSRI